MIYSGIYLVAISDSVEVEVLERTWVLRRLTSSSAAGDRAIQGQRRDTDQKEEATSGMTLR